MGKGLGKEWRGCLSGLYRRIQEGLRHGIPQKTKGENRAVKGGERVMKYPKVKLIDSEVCEDKVVEIEKGNICIPLRIAPLEIRGAGSLKDLGYYLHEEYNWQIVRDDTDNLVLIATIKRV